MSSGSSSTDRRVPGRGCAICSTSLKHTKAKTILILNKIDLVKKHKLLPVLDQLSKEREWEAIVPVSALTGDNVDAPGRSDPEALPEGEALYPADYLTDQPERNMVAEMVREQVLRLTRDELPFSTAVLIDKFQEPTAEDHMTRIWATILVERESQKPIVIGRGGEMIKEIGTAARHEIETFLQNRVFLDLRVAVKEQWREDERMLDELGMKDPQISEVALVLAVVAVVLAITVGSAQTGAGPIVVLISFDGWRWDYIDRAEVPHLRALAARGVRADGLIPSFPSKTFPNHYTLVTGLYPERHGIVSNVIVDPGFPQRFTMASQTAKTARWWGGEPLWNTAMLQGRRAASMFWPGSEAPIGGLRPTYWRPYDEAMPNAARIAQVLRVARIARRSTARIHHVVLQRCRYGGPRAWP